MRTVPDTARAGQVKVLDCLVTKLEATSVNHMNRASCNGCSERRLCEQIRGILFRDWQTRAKVVNTLLKVLTR